MSSLALQEIKLTKEQKEIICAPPAHYIITAVAGSGKTTTLAYRIGHLLEQGYEPKRILILMFNRAAREDFSLKLQPLVSGQTHTPEVRTFHAMGYRLYQRFIKEGYLPAFHKNILSDKETDYHLWRLMGQILDSEDLREAKKNKKEYVEMSRQFLETVKGGLDSPECVYEQLKLGDKFSYVIPLFKRFEEWRRQQARISYSDMLYEPVMAIRAYPELEKLVANKMDILLVDEYQDTNDIQHALLKYIAGTRAKITVVGDPDQTIYEFRGAKPDYIIHGFSKEFPDANHLTLSYSFRYGHSVSLLANHLISKNSGRKDLLCKSHQNNPSTRVTRHSCVDDGIEISKLLATVPTHELNQCAVLARVWSQTVGIELALLEKEIPYHIDGYAGVFRSIETQCIRALLELSAGYFSDFPEELRKEKFDLLFHFPHVGLPDTQIKAICANLSRFPSQWGKLLLESIPADLKKIQAIKLERLARTLIKVERSKSTVKQLLNGYIDEVQLYEGIYSLSLSHDHAEEKIASVKGVVRFISQRQGDARELLRHLDKLQSNSERQHQYAVHICTIHKAKGLEWDNIFVPGLNDKTLPYSYRTEVLTKTQLESERRLLYVAMTRSKQHLHLFVPKQQSNTPSQASRFEFELSFKQSLKLGESLDRNENICQLEPNEKTSMITQQYAKEMGCEFQQDKSAEKDKIEDAGQPVWFSQTVQHCVLGKGQVKGEQATSFSVEFEDMQTRTFSKETADRFFTVAD